MDPMLPLVAAAWLLAAGPDGRAVDLARCAAMAEAAARLACYDALARDLGVPGPARASAGAWNLWRGPEPGPPVVELRVPANREVRGAGGESARPLLVLRCDGPALSARVRTGVRVAPGEAGDGSAVILRFDADAPLPVNLEGIEERRALAFDSGAQALSLFLAHRALYVHFLPEGAAATSVSFELTGLREALGDLLPACGLEVGPDGWVQTPGR